VTSAEPLAFFVTMLRILTVYQTTFDMVISASIILGPLLATKLYGPLVREGPKSIVLLVLYTLLSSLSDIGFLGFYTCTIEGPVQYDRPGSITDEQLARSTILSNFISGSNPDSIPAYRCNASSIRNTSLPDTPLYACAEWHNSTLLDPALFTGINSTDSDMLLPRRLGRYADISSNTTSFQVNAGIRRIQVPTISNGILVKPTDTGFQAVFGVPNITVDQKFTLEKAMALEVEVGCMSLGIYSVKDANGPADLAPTFIQTNGTWRRYSGPDGLYDLLSNWTDAMREYSRPLFNTSTLNSEGLMLSINWYPAKFTDATFVDRTLLTTDNSWGYGDQDWFIQGCGNSLKERLGLPLTNTTGTNNYACSLLGLSGTISQNGKFVQVQNKMLCASIPQINMVTATIQSNSKNSISLEISCIPSDLHYVRADYWETQQIGVDTQYTILEPIERFTLGENPDGLSTHYISQRQDYDNSVRIQGPGSAGNVLARIGLKVITPPVRSSIQTMEETGREAIFSPSTITRWTGQVGSSIILASLQYNPWVALESPPIAITSGTGSTATCYHPTYAVAFLLPALAATIALFWFLNVLTDLSIRHLRYVRTCYGGLYTYWKAVYPDVSPEDTILIWKQHANPHLDVYSSQKYVPIERDAPTAVDYLELTKD
ncbi:2486_t:CDS:2, partial [Acaulospora colombiana]